MYPAASCSPCSVTSSRLNGECTLATTAPVSSLPCAVWIKPAVAKNAANTTFFILCPFSVSWFHLRQAKCFPCGPTDSICPTRTTALGKTHSNARNTTRNHRKSIEPMAHGSLLLQPLSPNIPRSTMKSITACNPSPFFRLLNVHGRSGRMRRVSPSITSSDAPT